MDDDTMRGFYSVHPLEEFGGEGPEWDELRRLDGEARAALVEVLEDGRDPQADEQYRALEDRVTELKARLQEEQG